MPNKPTRIALALVELAIAAVLALAGAPLLLYGFLLSMRAGSPAREAWYETTALIPIIPGALALVAVSWLIRDARARLSSHFR